VTIRPPTIPRVPVAVREVDQLDDAVDERVAERHERPDRAVREARHEVVAEPDEVAVVDQILDAVVDGHRQQDDDQSPLPEERQYGRPERGRRFSGY
jgi:hypothetical protein